ncbi:pyridoxal-dependent decarboxylase, exosortase A system-associated [Neptunomonas japonica]|uniref:pyridoxal-dependent decarboxylase, exosortase A system-associated n=1 Tax=Neptunomonas japonica TaxID=417574 RepID=UPI000414DC3B|nr:pyridoxal-dependent decarboxylase, exosortase A system-associated [Neptunomonas japonica]
MKEAPKHANMDWFPVIDNHLHAGGISIERLAIRTGKTPFYVYDRNIMTRKVEILRESLPEGLHLHYAMKANPMPAVVQHLSQLTDGIDVASVAEMQVALNTGIDPLTISFAGPGKTDAELKSAVAAGIIINMESEGEMERIAQIGDAISVLPNVSIRVNPDFELKTSGMKMGGGPKPFGVDAERVPDMLQRCGQLNLNFKGFHIFSGSQNLRPEAIIEAQTKTFALAYRLAEFAPQPITWLNIGGGLGIPYFPGEATLPLGEIAENLKPLIKEAQERLPEAEIVMELGRYFVGEAGLYVSEVVECKESRGEKYAITNGGLHHHLSASGNFGQIIRKNYPVCIANRVTSQTTEKVNIVGPLCTPLDIIADKTVLPEVCIGDLIAVYQSGAYGLSASPRDFLSHPHPAEILV